ncbi:MAG: SsrA-binding protein SmpB [Firmicutes bacterium]|nr:SsrA-binding protein SmpB [Bacillota bacterium]
MLLIEQNKKAFFDYFIEETIEAGIALKGGEVKSIKQKDCNLRDSFCFAENGEMILKNFYVAPYQKGEAIEARRDRKLLLHRREINRLIGKSREKGYTMVPTKIYFSRNKVKVEIGLAKGKHSYDKKDAMKEKDMIRDAEREIAKYK